VKSWSHISNLERVPHIDADNPVHIQHGAKIQDHTYTIKCRSCSHTTEVAPSLPSGLSMAAVACLVQFCSCPVFKDVLTSNACPHCRHFTSEHRSLQQFLADSSVPLQPSPPDVHPPPPLSAAAVAAAAASASASVSADAVDADGGNPTMKQVIEHLVALKALSDHPSPYRRLIESLTSLPSHVPCTLLGLSVYMYDPNVWHNKQKRPRRLFLSTTMYNKIADVHIFYSLRLSLHASLLVP
jgi:hypothetical protein